MSANTSRRYPPKLRAIAVRIFVEVRADHEIEVVLNFVEPRWRPSDSQAALVSRYLACGYPSVDVSRSSATRSVGRCSCPLTRRN